MRSLLATRIKGSKYIDFYFVKVDGHSFGWKDRKAAESRAERDSSAKPATQIAVYQGSPSSEHKCVSVYLNGSKLPRSAWFVGFKK